MKVDKPSQIVIDFTDCSGGLNTVEHPLRIGTSQIQKETIGFILKKSGLEAYPGATGLTPDTTFTTYLRMLSGYKDYAGVERLLALSDGILYSVETSGANKGDITSLYDLTGTGEGWSCDSHGKKFVCNGTSVVKVESATAYRVGIAPPVGVTATASAGAGLPDGDYSIYASYGRRVGGTDKLYSTGQYVGTVTLGSGNNQIDITAFPNSADAQVGQKIIWVKGVTAGEVIHYLFYATDNNTTTTFTISSDAAKNTAVVYEYNAKRNGLPPAGEFVYSFANRIWVIKENVLYYSNKAYNEYDLEVFDPANTIIFPYKCTGIFSIGFDLFLNTPNGIVVLPNADPVAVSYLIEPRWHFCEMRTMDRWNNGVIGLTNDGVRLFDGLKFTDFDMSYFIKDIIGATYEAATNFKPCGIVYRRGIRSEYHLFWQDTTVSEGVNNRHAILNLDSMYFNTPEQNRFAWELQPYTGNYAAVLSGTNTLYIGQSHSSTSKIYEESKISDLSIDCYNYLGELNTTEQPYYGLFRSKTRMPDIRSIIRLHKIYGMTQNFANFKVRVIMADKIQSDTPWYTITTSIPGGGENARYDETNYDESYYPIENGAVFRKKIKELKGRSCYIEVSRTSNDLGFKLMEINVVGTIEHGNFS